MWQWKWVKAETSQSFRLLDKLWKRICQESDHCGIVVFPGWCPAGRYNKDPDSLLPLLSAQFFTWKFKRDLFSYFYWSAVANFSKEHQLLKKQSCNCLSATAEVWASTTISSEFKRDSMRPYLVVVDKLSKKSYPPMSIEIHILFFNIVSALNTKLRPMH